MNWENQRLRGKNLLLKKVGGKYSAFLNRDLLQVYFLIEDLFKSIVVHFDYAVKPKFTD